MTDTGTPEPAAPPAADGGASPHAAPAFRRDTLLAALIALSALLVCAIGYLVATVPSAWFPRAAEAAWGAKDLALVRGSGRVVGDELIVSATDATGIALVTVTTGFPSAEYPAIAWIVADLPEDAEVRLLWRTDVQPGKLNTAPVPVGQGRTLPVVVNSDPAWLGRITGVALAIHGPLPHPVRIRGVLAQPMGAAEIVGDRLHEWFAFERWNGTSINTIVGGADNQGAPLPALLALIVGMSGVAVVAIRRWRPNAFAAATPAILAGLFVAAWLALDARWTWNLVRQEHATAARYAGKDARDKHLASEDGPLYAFIEKARAVLPKTPVRIFIAADADYFRGRAAYHLYPNNVFFSPRGNDLPAANLFHAGDWLLVFQRHGMQFDQAQGKIRWDNGQTVNAELKLLEPGAALFVIR